MPMNPYTLYLLAKTGQKAMETGGRLLEPKFGKTKYGKQLSGIRKHGYLSPGQETNILNKVGTTAGRQSGVVSNRYIGSAINRGMGSSVAFQRGLREAQADVRRTVGDTAQDIYRTEEGAKTSAKLDYAKLADQDKQERMRAVVGTGSAIAGGIAEGAQKMESERDAREQSYMDAVTKFGAGRTREIGTPGGDKRYTGAYDPQTGGHVMPMEKIWEKKQPITDAFNRFQTSKSLPQLEAELIGMGFDEEEALKMIAILTGKGP